MYEPGGHDHARAVEHLGIRRVDLRPHGDDGAVADMYVAFGHVAYAAVQRDDVGITDDELVTDTLAAALQRGASREQPATAKQHATADALQKLAAPPRERLPAAGVHGLPISLRRPASRAARSACRPGSSCACALPR